MNENSRNLLTGFALVFQFLGTVSGIGFVLLALWFGYKWATTERSDAAARSGYSESAPVIRVPRTASKTISFMPGQATDIPNRIYRKVEVRAEYPLRVLSGQCQSDYTVQFFCDGDPADIFITDTRRMPLFLTPRANAVTITVTEF